MIFLGPGTEGLHYGGAAGGLVVKHVALNHPPATANALVLHNAEIAVDLAVLLAN